VSEAEVAEACLYLGWVKTSAEYLSKAAELFAVLTETECHPFLLALRAVLLRKGVHVFGDLGAIATKVAALQCPLAGQLMEVMHALMGGSLAREILRAKAEQERTRGTSMLLARKLQLYAIAHREETDKRLYLLEEALLLYGDSERVAPFRYAAALEEHYKTWPKGDAYLCSFLRKFQSRNPCSEPSIRAYQVLSRLRILRHDRSAASELARDTAKLVGTDWFALQALAAHCLQHLPLQKMGAELCRELMQTDDREMSGSVQMRLGSCCLRNGQVEEAERLISQALSVFSEPSLQRAQCTKLLAVCAQKCQQWSQAEKLYEEALSLYRDVHIGASFTLHTVAALADLYRKQKEPARALALTQAHVALVRSTSPHLSV
jgi:tetratricopeptide (TPR) repeat protein